MACELRTIDREMADTSQNRSADHPRQRDRQPSRAQPSRKAAEQAFRQSEVRFRELFELSPDAIFVSSNARIVFANCAAAKLLGADRPEQLVGNTVEDIVHPDYRRVVYDRIRKLQDEKLSVPPLEEKFLRLDGTIVDVEVTSQPFICDDQPAALVFARDITERKIAEEKLRRAEARYRMLVERLPAITYIAGFGEEGRWLYVSPEIESILGFSPAEWTADTKLWFKQLHPDDRERAITEEVNSRANGTPFVCEYRMLTRDGRVLWFRDEAVVHEEDGKPLFLRGIIYEITKRKLAEEALKESERRHRELVETARDVIFTLSPDGLIRSLNPAFESVTGWAREEWIGQSFMAIVTPEDQPAALKSFGSVLRGETPPVFELRVRKKDGTHLVGQFTATPQKQDGKVIGMLGIGRDITEYKNLEEQLLQSQKMDAIGRLAGGVAHDFNNILTVIMGCSDIALKRLDADQPLRKATEEIRAAAERAAALTRQLLAFSRKQVLAPKVVDLNGIVNQMQNLLRRLIGEHITLITKTAAGPAWVWADLGKLEQVIMNMVVNARDAMPSGGTIRIETANAKLTGRETQHDTALSDQFVLLAISDTGTGMSDDVKARIFEPFFTTKGPGKGTGLGLATCYGIIKQSNGHIEVDTELGRGTTFRIYLPRVAHAPEQKERANGETAVRQGTETILLVDDEPTVRELASAVLNDLGYTILTAANGIEALEVAQRRNGQGIDLVMTDVVMPHMGGRELAERFSAIQPNAKVLFISGYADDAVSGTAGTRSPVFFLQKPFTPAVLACKVREVLDTPVAEATVAMTLRDS